MRIHPETRVGALLEAHPEVEEALVALVPAFGKLKNPILRRTVAKVATLEQAARAGGVPLAELLAFLRDRLGQAADSEAAASGPSRVSAAVPAWYQPDRVVLELDAEALLAAGEHPIARIRAALAAHPPGATVTLVSGFEPAPLLELFSGEGTRVWCHREGDRYRTCLCQP